MLKDILNPLEKRNVRRYITIIVERDSLFDDKEAGQKYECADTNSYGQDQRDGSTCNAKRHIRTQEKPGIYVY